MQIKPSIITNIASPGSVSYALSSGTVNTINSNTSNSSYTELLTIIYKSTSEAITKFAVEKSIVLTLRREAELLVYMTHHTYITLFGTNPSAAFLEFDMI